MGFHKGKKKQIFFMKSSILRGGSSHSQLRGIIIFFSFTHKIFRQKSKTTIIHKSFSRKMFREKLISRKIYLFVVCLLSLNYRHRHHPFSIKSITNLRPLISGLMRFIVFCSVTMLCICQGMLLILAITCDM